MTPGSHERFHAEIHPQPIGGRAAYSSRRFASKLVGKPPELAPIQIKNASHKSTNLRGNLMLPRSIWLPQMSGALTSDGRRVICIKDWKDRYVTIINADSPWYIGETGLVDNEAQAVNFASSLGPVAPSTPSRTLNTTFQPSASKPVLCSYSVRTQVTNPLLAGSSTATVTLLSDANNPPTTERCRVEAISSVGVAVAIALTTANTAPLTYIAPPGHFVRLVSSTSGTASTSIISQAEEALG